MRRSPGTDLAVALALGLLGFVAALFVGGWLALALGGRLAGWLIAPAWLAGAGLAAWSATERRWRVAGYAGAVIGVATAGALLLGGAFFDVSWDGQAYHQEAVLALARGWNPLWDAPLSVEARPDDLWIDHYPKAAWIAQAILFRATGSLEAAKGLQLVGALAAVGLLFGALRARGLRARWAALVALLAAGNPIALAQSFSFYVDGLGLELLVTAGALALLVQRSRDPRHLDQHQAGRVPHQALLARPGAPLWLGLGAALALLANLKFTGLVYGGCFVVGVAGWLFWRRHPARRRFALTGAAALVAGALVLGFDPYVTNTLRQGHPFHPVMGAGAIDFIGIQLDPAFHRQSRLRRFLVGLFARASNENVAPIVKPPFTIAADELPALAYADVRLGGFGPLFSGAFLLAGALVLGRRRLGWRVPPAAWAVAALLMTTVWLNPVLWWARYVPQLWLLPVGALALAARGSPGPAGRAARAALALLLVADTAIVGVVAARAQRQASAAVARELATLAGGPIEIRFAGFEANAERLRAHGVSFRSVQTLSCAHPRRLFASTAAACPATITARTEAP